MPDYSPDVKDGMAVRHLSSEAAITREKHIKKWRRAWKLELIERHNPEWRDLAEEGLL